jgi:hypothetical protein
MEPTLDEIQKLLLLVHYLGMQGLSLTVGPLVGGAGDASKAAQKQSQVERLRQELDGQISSHLSTQLPNRQQVELLLLVSHAGHGLDALCREGLQVGRGHGPASSPKARKEGRELFEAGCEVLGHAIAAFTQRGTPACGKTVRKMEEAKLRAAPLLERLSAATGADAPLLAALSRLAARAQAIAAEIGAFLADFTPGPTEASPDRVRVGRS